MIYFEFSTTDGGQFFVSAQDVASALGIDLIIQRQKSFQTILSVAGKVNQPVYLSIDDTVVPKKKPSRRAARPMEGTGWHYSHLEGKKVYGYQIHTAIASTGSSTLCYSLRRCCPEHTIFRLLHKSIIAI